MDEEYTGEYPLLFLVTYQENAIEVKIVEEGKKALENSIEIEYEKDRKETKNALKKLLYGSLQTFTGKSLPWGNLTGIRPTKIPMKLLEEGWSNVEIANYMRETYSVSKEKTALAIAIANREKKLLEEL